VEELKYINHEIWTNADDQLANLGEKEEEIEDLKKKNDKLSSELESQTSILNG
jgi:cell shape-determining protein MreC